ncbi:hypothetical protein V5O48_006747 [Marasmius crinis-equi]|uniref:Uncharacterized protein n=1 Tax=Marasmius crinis-equi TaxID=585013 RepID=A0ABR3FJ67_9AGAR
MTVMTIHVFNSGLGSAEDFNTDPDFDPFAAQGDSYTTNFMPIASINDGRQLKDLELYRSHSRGYAYTTERLRLISHVERIETCVSVSVPVSGHTRSGSGSVDYKPNRPSPLRRVTA